MSTTVYANTTPRTQIMLSLVCCRGNANIITQKSIFTLALPEETLMQIPLLRRALRRIDHDNDDDADLSLMVEVVNGSIDVSGTLRRVADVVWKRHASGIRSWIHQRILPEI